METFIITKEFKAVMESLRELLWEYKKQGGNYKDLAARAGISPGVLTKFRQGKDITFESAYRLMRVLLGYPPISLSPKNDIDKLRKIKDLLA